jgi:signal transduction histidine kinase
MNRQLGELDKLKAEFVSVASHELKTPINVIIGYLQLLEEGVYGPLTPQQQAIHTTLGVQANTLLRLVKQLLDVSRFEAGGGRLELAGGRSGVAAERAGKRLSRARRSARRYVLRRGARRIARRRFLGPRSHQ